VSSQGDLPPDYPRVRDIGGGVVQIDTGHYGQPGTIGVFALPLPEGGFALIESGPGSTLASVEDGLARAGLDRADLRFVLVTHIHLDHAGAAGALAHDAELVVHEIGAPHMIDPSRLLASAERIYGDQMQALWGTMQPLDAARVRAVRGGETLDLAGLRVRVLATPGHASHHVSYLLDDGSLFTGDAAGVRLQGASTIRPALPPPEVDLEAWEASVRRMRDARPDRLVLTHFGVVADADAHLAEVPERNRAWADEVLRGMRAGEDDEALVARMQRREDAELARANVLPGVRMRYKVTSDAAMTVMGLQRYWTKRHPERLEASFPLDRPARIAVLASGRGSNLASLLAAFPPVRAGAAGAVEAEPPHAEDGTVAQEGARGALHDGAGGAAPDDAAANPLGAVTLVISNVADAPALDKARAAGVRAAHVPWRTREAFEAGAQQLLVEERIDLVCLAGFMRILSAEFTERYAGRLLNIHPSLLPSFRGLHAQRQALEAGARESGCTVHFVDAGVDSGRVVLQRRVPVLSGDDEARLAERILREEHLAYPEAVTCVLDGRAFQHRDPEHGNGGPPAAVVGEERA
jgi:formyltetrahydrofolate-dependent phosphoribosylglycinamide formyltransferase